MAAARCPERRAAGPQSQQAPFCGRLATPPGCCRCPYYRVADKSLYGSMGNLSAASTQYFEELATAKVPSCNKGFLQVRAGDAHAGGRALVW